MLVSKKKMPSENNLAVSIITFGWLEKGNELYTSWITVGRENISLLFVIFWNIPSVFYCNFILCVTNEMNCIPDCLFPNIVVNEGKIITAKPTI